LWKNVIDNNQYIQHHLFFTPWGDYNYLHLHGMINPFLRYLAFKEGEDKGGPGCNYDFGPAAKKSEDEDTDDDGDQAEWEPDFDPVAHYEFNWRRVKADPRFVYERASWRRMLPIQPPKREVWNLVRPGGEFGEEKRARKIGEKGRRMGEIYKDVVGLEKDVCCVRTRTFLRSSERYWAIAEINVEIKPWDSEEDVVEGAGSYINQLQF